MKIEDAVTEFESGRTIVTGDSWWRSPTDETWVVICSGGRRWWHSDLDIPVLYRDPELAVSEWLRVAKDYAEGKSGILYWNARPSLLGHAVHGKQRSYWTVVSKLLISDKSPKENRVAKHMAEDSGNAFDALMAIPRI